MEEIKKIYSKDMIYNAIYGVETMLKLYGDYHINISKVDNDLFELRLYKEGYQKFVVVNTIDCLYNLVDGYYKAIFDNCKLK